MALMSGSKKLDDGSPHWANEDTTVEDKPEEWLAVMRRQTPASRSRMSPAR